MTAKDSGVWRKASGGPRNASGQPHNCAATRVAAPAPSAGSKWALFAVRSGDDPLGAQQQRLRNLEAQRPCGLHIDHQIEPGELLDGQIGRLGTLEQPINKTTDSGKDLLGRPGLGHQAAVVDDVGIRVHVRDPRRSCETQDLLALLVQQRIG